jgi:hypothetical protein
MPRESSEALRNGGAQGAEEAVRIKAYKRFKGSTLRAVWIRAFLRDLRPQKQGYRSVAGMTEVAEVCRSKDGLIIRQSFFAIL